MSATMQTNIIELTATELLTINSGSATLPMPIVNPTLATVETPYGLFKDSPTGEVKWLPLTGGVLTNDFNYIGIYKIYGAGSTTVTLAQMFPDIVGNTGPLLLEVTLVGGGGGGAAIYNNSTTCSTGGGAGGHTAMQSLQSGLTPATSFTFVTGAGGAGGPGGNTVSIGADGSPTLMTVGTTIFGAAGGTGGGKNATSINNWLLLAGGGINGFQPIPPGANTAPTIYIKGGSGGNGVDNIRGAPAGWGGPSTMCGINTGPYQVVPGANYPGRDADIPGDGEYSCGGGGSGMVLNASSLDTTKGGNGAGGSVIATLWYNKT